MTFALKGNHSRTIPASHSTTELEISGHWHVQGPQVVGGAGGAPQWVYDLFKEDPRIKNVAISYEDGGVVWGRPADLREEVEGG